MGTGLLCRPRALFFSDFAAGADRGAVFLPAASERLPAGLTRVFVFAFLEAVSAGFTALDLEAGFFTIAFFLETETAGVLAAFPKTVIFFAPAFFPITIPSWRYLEMTDFPKNRIFVAFRRENARSVRKVTGFVDRH
jgi:hypothetical protein